ncbi:MAG: anthranilate phosphoribosyltransferase [Cyclobacteriaceae bacterium]|nr:anthranilate phosphoribosyltransferase [Cyclobacteriaceae bacterium]
MKQLLIEITNHKVLSHDEAKEALRLLASGNFNENQMAVFMTVFMMRKITVEELMGFRDAMLDLCTPVDLSEYDAMDLCGTGGDGKDTFNISTLSSFVVAGAGQAVTKHGNTGVSSICGSSNLLAHFGYEFTNDADALKRSLDEAGICFLHAPLFHSAMKNVAPVRKSLGLKTFFNMLGPMVNPSFPNKQLVGVFDLELARLYGYLYQQTEKQFTIVHSIDGYDEISLTGAFKVISNNGEMLYEPEMLGLKKLKEKDLAGGNTIQESATIFMNILKGEGTESQNEVVKANAGMALHAANQQLSFEEAFATAEESLQSGAALEAFKKMTDKKTQIAVGK